MLKKTSSRHAPWQIIRSNDKRRARLNCIAHLLKTIPHKQVSRDKVRLPARSGKDRYDDQRSLRGMKFVASDIRLAPKACEPAACGRPNGSDIRDLSSSHRDGNAAHGGRQFHADLWAAELQDDAIAVLQLNATGSGRNGAARADHGV